MANTLEDQLLTNVRVEMEEPEGFRVVGCVPIESLPYSKPGTTYTIVELTEQDTGGGWGRTWVGVGQDKGGGEAGHGWGRGKTRVG